MAQNDIYSLAKLLGAKNITDSPFANSPAGINYVNREGQYENAQKTLQEATNPIGALTAGIGFYLHSKNKAKALEELGGELQAKSDANENKRSTLANLFPEDQRGIAQTLDMDTLTKLAGQRLAPANPDAGLDRQYKIAQINALNQKSQPNPGKPLPTPALKLQNQELETIGSVNAINSDLGAIENQIDTGQLKLGPAENVISGIRDATGLSNENSNNYASFKTTLEKLRNDSLRLNSGVQTEGDAQREWKGLFGSINNPTKVKERLAEIKKINDRAVNIRKANVDQIQANYGREAFDFSQYENQPAAIGAGQTPNNPNKGASRRRVYDPKTGTFH